ncbi:MAG TPA: AMP-binding protein [Acidimicrobiia bacterium]|nr:AMP-binding protein [Acidimicrobiia bacterium]
MFRRIVARRRHALAVVDDRRTLTYGELDQWTDRVAAALLDLGLEGGDRVALQLPNSAEFCAVYFGCQRAGVVPVGFPVHFRDKEVGYIIDRSGARAYLGPTTWGGFDFGAMLERVGTPSLAGYLALGADPASRAVDLGGVLAAGRRPEATELAVHAPSPDDVAQILVTSGTESDPKLPTWIHNAMPGMGTIGDAAGMTEDDRNFVLVPVCSGFGMGVGPFLTLAWRGATLILREKFTPADALATIEREAVNVVCGVGAQLIAMLDSPQFDDHDYERLRTVVSFGGPVAERVVHDIQNKMSCSFVSGYGMSEVPCVICITRPGDPPEIVSRTVGRPFPEWISIRIAGADGADSPLGQDGEILLDGPGVGGGYFGAPELNRAWDAEGWLHTGDLGHLDGEGNLTITGRQKDIILRGGMNLSPREVEEAIFTHPAVSDVAVVAMPDDRLGERACAFVVLRSGHSLDLDQLTTFLRQERRLSVYKLPERLEIIDALPLNPAGKVKKYVLRQIAAQLCRPQTQEVG